MTSTGCFVYITLHGQIEPVVAGRYELVGSRGAAVGRFAYARSYIARPDAVVLDPIELNTLQDDTYQRADEPLMFPALRDASPDAWGRRMLDDCGIEGEILQARSASISRVIDRFP